MTIWRRFTARFRRRETLDEQLVRARAAVEGVLGRDTRYVLILSDDEGGAVWGNNMTRDCCTEAIASALWRMQEAGEIH